MLYCKGFTVTVGRHGKGYVMEERRKNKRTQMESRLLIKRVDGNVHSEADIEIVDVSKTGIGFISKSVLQIGEIYESYLTIWTKEVLHAFLQVVRIEMRQSDYFYGAVFIGMPEMDASRIAVYQAVNEE